MQPQIHQKCYTIDLSRIEEGYLCSEKFAYAENRNQAKAKLLEQVRHEDLEIQYTFPPEPLSFADKIEWFKLTLPTQSAMSDEEIENYLKENFKTEWELTQRLGKDGFLKYIDSNSVKYTIYWLMKNGYSITHSQQKATERYTKEDMYEMGWIAMREFIAVNRKSDYLIALENAGGVDKFYNTQKNIYKP